MRSYIPLGSTDTPDGSGGRKRYCRSCSGVHVVLQDVVVSNKAKALSKREISQQATLQLDVEVSADKNNRMRRELLSLQ